MIEIMTHTENSESVSDVNAMSLVNYSFVFFFFCVSWDPRTRTGSQPQLSLLPGYC